MNEPSANGSANRHPERTAHRNVVVRQPYRFQTVDDVLDPAQTALADVMSHTGDAARVLTFVDNHVADAHPDITQRITTYITAHADRLTQAGPTQIVTGGERAKNDWRVYEHAARAIHDAALCRHSYVLAIGGGAMLDAVGFAAATAHRGVRLIRLPTTTLAQADAGLGVKNGLNAFGRKNFLGTFAVPWAVINDPTHLTTLPDREWRCGFSEAVKVALIKDHTLFERIETDAKRIARRDLDAARPIITRSAELHLDHIIAGGDPFELTTARPLDFGHWAAHKLEQMTDYQLRHGEAVAIGVALDTIYSSLGGQLPWNQAARVLDCLHRLGFTLHDDALNDTNNLLAGLDEFREHLGGRLTIALIDAVGRQRDVHDINRTIVAESINRLAQSAADHASQRC